MQRAAEALERSRRLARILIALALFLVLVVMSIQYESLRNPVIIDVPESTPRFITSAADGL